MKFRSDYVTNSSSSSFILGFTSPESINEELLKGFPAYYSEQFKTVLKDVENAEQFDKDEAIKRIREEMEIEAWYKVQDCYRNRTGCFYSEAMAYLKTDKGKKEIEDCIERLVNNVIPEMNEKSIFVEVSYSDNDGDYFSELEHEIMPIVESTVISFNHH